MRYHVPDMNCGHCTASVEKALTAMDPAAVVKVDLADHTFEIETSFSQAQVIRALGDIGFETTPAP